MGTGKPCWNWNGNRGSCTNEACNFLHDASRKDGQGRPVGTGRGAGNRNQNTFEALDAGPAAKKPRDDKVSTVERVAIAVTDVADLRRKVRAHSERLDKIDGQLLGVEGALRVEVANVGSVVDTKMDVMRGEMVRGLTAVATYFYDAAKIQMEACADALRLEMKNLTEVATAQEKSRFEYSGGRDSVRLLSDLAPAGGLFVASLRPCTDMPLELKFEDADGQEQTFDKPLFLDGPAALDGVPHCKFIRRIDVASGGNKVTGGERPGFSRTLVIPEGFSLGAALQALNDLIFKCKKCGKTEADADCDECPYKGTMPGSPTFSPKTPPKRLEIQFPSLQLDAIYKLQGDLSDRDKDKDKDKDRDRNEDDDRDKDRDRDRSKSKNSRNSRNSKNKR